MQQGLDEDLYHRVSDYDEIGAFTEAEKLAAETAERFCWDHEAMTADEDYWARMKQHFTDQQILELLTLVGYCVAMGRTLGDPGDRQRLPGQPDPRPHRGPLPLHPRLTGAARHSGTPERLRVRNLPLRSSSGSSGRISHQAGLVIRQD